MVCVTTTTFSININGDLHGFFKSSRGLRQGDPISPYLFTLVIEVLTLMIQRRVRMDSNFEYHPGCHQHGISNLCFADDFILFFHDDYDYVKVIHDSLDEFKKCSGLVPSMQKSMAFFANVSVRMKARHMQLLPFEEGSLPVRYLGVPLVSSRLLHQDCKVLIDRVKNKLNDWKNKSLSFAGRVQLIISVLSAMHIYWSSVFL